MSYTPNTEADRAWMMRRIGIHSTDELFADVPSLLRSHAKPNLPDGVSEHETVTHLTELAENNCTACTCFLGAGAYDHLIPHVIHHLVSRQEFLTAYTPYQPEVSQGTLEAIFSYQTGIARLYGMDCSNASLYDGTSAAAEAVELSLHHTGRNRILVSAGLHPEYLATIRTYMLGRDNVTLDIIPLDKNGETDLPALTTMIKDDVSLILLANPNFFGVIETKARQVCELAHNHGALSIISSHPLALGLIAPPGKLGADIAIGEGQPLGIPMSYGGPYLGIMAVRKELIRKMPGRIIGKTTDIDGKEGYVMVLQTREQHIRREKATSNICSNEGLLSTTAAIYMSLVGKEGIKEIAEQNYAKAHYAAELACAIPGVSLKHSGSFWNEFILTTPKPAEDIFHNATQKGISIGVPLSWFYPEMKNDLLIAVTEKRTREEINQWAKVLAEVSK